MTIHCLAWIFCILTVLVRSCVAFPNGETCGTTHPNFSNTMERAIPSCGLHECDEPAIRDLYLLNGESPTINIRMNLIYFGDLSGSNRTNYDAQLDFFRAEFARLMNITWTINTTVVNDRYQFVAGSLSNLTEHQRIAQEFYVPGAMTVLLTRFDPILDRISGYAFVPQAMNFETAPAKWYTILNLPSASTPRSTIMLHEIGHMLGLFHTFTDKCQPCSENVNSEDLDLVGDLCSDTKPMWRSFACDPPSSTDCNNQPYSELSQLPLDNYMGYTPDSCKDTFTAQQTARARCYLDRLIDFIVVHSIPPETPSNTPTVSSPNSDPPTSGPGSPSPFTPQSEAPRSENQPIVADSPYTADVPVSSSAPSAPQQLHSVSNASALTIQSSWSIIYKLIGVFIAMTCIESLYWEL